MTSGPVVKVLNDFQDLALQGTATQSSDYCSEMTAPHAIRGSFHSKKGFGGVGSYAHAKGSDRYSWWQVNVSHATFRGKVVREVHIYGRPGYGRRLTHFQVQLFGADGRVLAEEFVRNEAEVEAVRIEINGVEEAVACVRLTREGVESGNERCLNLNAVQVFGW